MRMRIDLFCSAFLVLCAWSVAQKPAGVAVHAPRTAATSGKEMYLAYCATCHGKEGKGDGPVASALKVPPSDLTTLSKRNSGKFPSLEVANSISGGTGTPAHGSKEMPVWGPVFLNMEHQHDSQVRLRVANLTEYIKSLQQK